MNYLLAMGANGGSLAKYSGHEVRRGLGERIVRQRQRKGWSQGELARQLGITRHRLGKWEQGQNAPGLAELMALVETLEVTFEELAFGRTPSGAPLPPTQRRQMTMCVQNLLTLLRPMLQAPKPEVRGVDEEGNSLRRHGGVDVRKE